MSEGVSGEGRDLEQYRGLVVSIAQRLIEKHRLQRFREEVIALGWEGLQDATTRFDASRGTKFSTYAYYRVRGAILDGCRAMGWVSRRRRKRVERDGLFNEHQGALYEDEGGFGVAPVGGSELGSLARDLDAMVGDAAAIFLLSDMDEDGEEEGIADPRPGPEALTTQRDVSRWLRQEIAKLDASSRAVLEASFFEGQTLDEIGDRMGCSKSWACRLRGNALRTLRKRLERRDVW